MQSIRTTLALITLAAAGFAQAQEATPMSPAAPSMLDRASVLAETRRALAADRIVWGNEGSDAFGATMSQRDRAAVIGEAATRQVSSAELLKNRLMYGM